MNDPPLLTNGSGSPVIGSRPMVIPMFTKTWQNNKLAIPVASRLPVGSFAVHAVRK